MLSADQVTALAPDAASVKAGRGLAAARKWDLIGADEDYLWGLAKGSGAKPYQVRVEIGEFATKCSCPSRKFPCKHALGLMFLLATDPAAAEATEHPDWLTEWIDSRSERKEKAAARATKKKAAKPKDEKAAAKRREKREARIEDGIDLLDQFLLDLIRNGLGQDQVSDPETWSDLARRLVDGQAPGLAGFVRALGDLPHSSPDWEQTLLHELGSLHLLLSTYRKRATLPEELRSEVEQLIGWPVDKEEILKGTGIKDRWFVAARRVTEQDRLLTSATWLLGEQSRRWALVLRFAALPSRPAEPWPLGSVVETELVFYPGAEPDRALPRNDQAPADTTSAMPEPLGGFSDLLQAYASGLALNPWRTRRLFHLLAQPTRHEEALVLVDREGRALPWKATSHEEAILGSLCGGRPTPLCGEWNGRFLTLHAAADGGTWLTLQTPAA